MTRVKKPAAKPSKRQPKNVAKAEPKTRLTNGRPKGRRDAVTSARQIKVKADILDAMRHRMAGLSLAEIGDEMGLSTTRVHQLLTAGLERTMAETADEARELDIRRMDGMLKVLWPLALGDKAAGIAPATGAINSVLEIINRRGKMHGYDVQAPPPGVNVDVNVSASVNVGAAREATVSGLAKLRAASDAKRAALDRITSTVVG
jgi:predicted DNA-binding protein (UPF0251 family)